MGGRSAGKRTSGTGAAKNRSICNNVRHNPPVKRRLGRLDRQRSPAEKGMWKAGNVFYPENSWGIADRHANDRARAEENAAKRQRREWAAKGRNYQGDYPEQAIVINTTRRRGGNQDRGRKEQETEHTKYLREQLAEEEKERLAGMLRLEIRRGKRRKDEKRKTRQPQSRTPPNQIKEGGKPTEQAADHRRRQKMPMRKTHGWGINSFLLVFVYMCFYFSMW